MKWFVPSCVAMALAVGLMGDVFGDDKAETKTEGAGLLSHKIKSLDGKDVDLSKYKGKVLVIVNVASRCGYTPQYEGLQALQKKYGAKGLAVLGFPCNQFGKQEPGTPAEIAEFCKSTYGVTFDMFEKVDVNGEGQCSLYRDLTSATAKFPGPIKWNFEKFVIGKDGNVVARFKSGVDPDSAEMSKLLEAELAK